MTSYAFQKKVRMTFVMMLILLAVSAFAFPVELNAAEVVSEVKGGDYTTALVCFAAALAFACGAFGAGIDPVEQAVHIDIVESGSLFAADQQMSLTDIHVPIILSVTLSNVDSSIFDESPDSNL